MADKTLWQYLTEPLGPRAYSAMLGIAAVLSVEGFVNYRVEAAEKYITTYITELATASGVSHDVIHNAVQVATEEADRGSIFGLHFLITSMIAGGVVGYVLGPKENVDNLEGTVES